MGLFSFTCAKTHLPIMCDVSCDDPKKTCVVALFRNGDRLIGTYDGYGRVGGTEIDYAAIEAGKIKLVLKHFYRDEPFYKLGPSHCEPGQGHFHTQTRVLEWYKAGGFKSYKAYIAAYKKAYKT